MTTIVDRALAIELSALITHRSVAATNVDAALHARPYKRENFAYWVNVHREASAKLIAMGIDVVTYDEVKP
jgi:hypothetical protein